MVEFCSVDSKLINIILTKYINIIIIIPTQCQEALVYNLVFITNNISNPVIMFKILMLVWMLQVDCKKVWQ